MQNKSKYQVKRTEPAAHSDKDYFAHAAANALRAGNRPAAVYAAQRACYTLEGIASTFNCYAGLHSVQPPMINPRFTVGTIAR